MIHASKRYQARHKLLKLLKRKTLEEMIGESKRPHMWSRLDLEKYITENWYATQDQVEEEIKDIIEKAK